MAPRNKRQARHKTGLTALRPLPLYRGPPEQCFGYQDSQNFG
jgi:hypothetical protein